MRALATECEHIHLPAKGYGMCNTCYHRWARHKKKEGDWPPPKKEKLKPECGHPDREYHASGKCNSCYSAWTVSSRRERRQARTKYEVQWAIDNPERTAEIKRFSHVKKAYGLTKEEYLELADRANGKCEICLVSFGESVPHVDHCHSSKQVRGLLCARCNHGLGNFRDTPKFLEGALAYLSRAHPDRL